MGATVIGFPLYPYYTTIFFACQYFFENSAGCVSQCAFFICADKLLQYILRHTASRQKHLQMLGRLVYLYEVSLDMMSSVNILILGNVVTVKASVLGLAFGRYRALGYVHYLSRIILAFMSEYHKRKCLTGLCKGYFHTELEAPLAEQRDSPMRRFGGT